MQKVLNYVGEEKIDTLEFLVFPSASSEYTFYEDDGLTFDYEKGNYSLIKFSINQNQKSISLNVQKIKNDYQSSVTNYSFRFVGVEKPRKVLVNKNEIKDFTYKNNSLTIITKSSELNNIELIY